MIPDINLLPKKERKFPPSRIYLMVFSIVGTILLSFVIYQYVQSLIVKQSFEENVAQLSATIEKYNEQLGTDNKESDEIVASIQYTQGMNVGISKINEVIISSLPNQNMITQYSYSDGIVTLQTQFSNMNQIAAFIKNLSGSPYFSDVAVNEIIAGTNNPAANAAAAYTGSLSLTVNSSPSIIEGGEADE